MHVLFVSHSFPPLATAQAIQMGKVVRALEASGCHATVIAAASGEGAPFQMQTGHVQYLPCWQPPAGRSLYARASDKLAREWCSCSSRFGWVRSAIKCAIDIERRSRPDCIITSSHPFQSHLVGLEVKRRTGLPWLASLGDPWPVGILPSPYRERAMPFCTAWQKHLLSEVLRSCDAIQMPSKYALELTEHATGLSLMQKAYAVPHIGSHPEREDDGSYAGWIAHVGDLNRQRISLPLLLAIKRVRAELGGRFRGLLCVGKICPEFRHEVQALELQDSVRIVGHVPEPEAMQIGMSSSALLVIEADMDTSPFLPSKFADYAMMGKCIIALTPCVSAIRDYFTAFGGGIAVDHNPDHIANALHRVFADDRRSCTASAPIGSLAEPFSPLTVAAQYMSILTELIARRVPASCRAR